MAKELRDCPFCHSKAEWKEASWTGIVYPRCSNMMCLVRPYVYNEVFQRNLLVIPYDKLKSEKPDATEQEIVSAYKEFLAEIWNGESLHNPGIPSSEAKSSNDIDDIG